VIGVYFTALAGVVWWSSRKQESSTDYFLAGRNIGWFAIGASLAYKTADRISVALWLSFAKLVLHPIAVGICALLIFDVASFDAGVMIAAASLPVAGNVYILAQHYNVAPHRVSTSILVSTLISIATVSLVISWISTL
jgi:predicted permease